MSLSRFLENVGQAGGDMYLASEEIRVVGQGGCVFLRCLPAKMRALLVGRGGMHPDVHNPLAYEQ